MFTLCFSFQSMGAVHWDEIEGEPNQTAAIAQDRGMLHTFNVDFEARRAPVLKLAENIYARHVHVISRGRNGNNRSVIELDRDSWMAYQNAVSGGLQQPRTILHGIEMNGVLFQHGFGGVATTFGSTVARLFTPW